MFITVQNGLHAVGSALEVIALIAFLLLQPVLTYAPPAMADVIILFVMGLICFIKCGLTHLEPIHLWGIDLIRHQIERTKTK